MNEVLTPHQTSVATNFIAAEEAKREHVVVSLSGAHAYGFPSPDSDLDLKAIHVAPTATLLGLGPEPRSVESLKVVDGIEVDYSSNEIQPVLKGILHGNGNYIERVLGHLQPHIGKDLASLRPLVQSALSRNLHRHYSGFARQQYKEWEKTGFRSAKKLLYVVRTSMTGIHALRAGEIVTDVTRFAHEKPLLGVLELIGQKRRGERSELPESLGEEWRGRVDGFLTRLDEAAARSSLPGKPSNEARSALEAWLIDLRRRRF